MLIEINVAINFPLKKNIIEKPFFKKKKKKFKKKKLI